MRTDPDAPKHKGISVLIIPTDAPGITRRPFGSIIAKDDLDFNEVFFDDVVVPAENLIGELHGGMARGQRLARPRTGHALAQLLRQPRPLPRGDERGGHHHAASTPTPASSTGTRRWPSTPRRIKLLGYRTLAKTRRGTASNEQSILKLFGSEAIQQALGTALEALGPAALDHTVLSGPFEHLQIDAHNESWFNRYLRTFAGTIAGGTSEIQRNIVAERVLGLPR